MLKQEYDPLFVDEDEDEYLQYKQDLIERGIEKYKKW